MSRKQAEQRLLEADRQAQQAGLSLYDRLKARSARARDLADKRWRVERQRVLEEANKLPESEKAAKLAELARSDQVGVVRTFNPATGTMVLEADHIVPIREIVDMEGFAKLGREDQLAVRDLEKNLVMMDEAANASKGDRSWRAWPNARNFYDEATIQNMIKREDELRKLIRQEIDRRLAAAKR
jgi:hypothetical protein